MTPTPDGSSTAGHITEAEVEIFRSSIDFWRAQSEAWGVHFPWFPPRLWSDGTVITGDRHDAAYTIGRVNSGYELYLSVERQGDSAPTFYTRFEDAVKAVALVLGGSFRLRAWPDRPLLSWRDSQFAGVLREPAGDSVVCLRLERHPDVYCIVSKYDHNEFDPAMAMSVDEFDRAIFNDPGLPIPGRS